MGFPAEAVMLNQHETESERPNVQGKVWSPSMSGGGGPHFSCFCL